LISIPIGQHSRLWQCEELLYKFSKFLGVLPFVGGAEFDQGEHGILECGGGRKFRRKAWQYPTEYKMNFFSLNRFIFSRSHIYFTFYHLFAFPPQNILPFC